jgi:hypothetical protein
MADMRPDPESSPTASVNVGTQVHTLDGQQLGVISELRGPYFKVKTKRFQRDYWLRTDSVRSAAPGQPVILNVPQERLDDIKMVDIERLT